MIEEGAVRVSFVIPAFNEEESIAVTLRSIFEGDLSLPYEVIVVDNNSTDRTSEIASGLGAKVIVKKEGTISSVRNVGVDNSKGNVIVFLDADVSLTPEWFGAIDSTIHMLENNPNIITGSNCSAPECGSWIEKFWFNSYVDDPASTHLGTGHLITTRELFYLNNGFDELLETGEDYAFCMEAIKNKAKIILNPALHVIHRDYPQSVLAFIKREAWHGMGDVSSLDNIMRSKVALAALVFIMLHVALLIPLFVPDLPSAFSLVPAAGVLGLVTLSSFLKFKHCRIRVKLVNSIIFYLYFLGRSLSFIKALFGKN